MNKIYLTIFLTFVTIFTLSAEEVEFKSKLFKQGTLLFSDDFDEAKYKGKYGPNKKNIKQVEDGTLEILPIPDRKSKLTVMHIYNIPKKFVCHLRYKVISKEPGTGVGLQIGGHKIHLNSTKEGYRLLFRESGKSYTNTETKGFVANEWIDMIIEYREGKMLLKINGSEKIYEHNKLSMGDAKTILFKNPKADQILLDYVRLWKVE